MIMTTKNPTPTSTLGPPDDDAREVYLAIQAYSLRMASVVNRESSKSTALSAFSLFPTLAQLAIASELNSNTNVELMSAMKTSKKDEKTVIRMFTKAYEKISKVAGIEWKLANKLYFKKDPIYKINEHLLAASKSMFKSELQQIEFESPTAVKEINEWLAAETNGRTKDLVKPGEISKDTEALFVNSMYFKGKWQRPFNETKTRRVPFYNGNKTLQVSMMHQTGLMRYLKHPMLSAELLELPYEGGEAAFLLILPNKKRDLMTLQDDLRNTETVIQAAMNDVKERLVEAHIPKIKIDTTLDLTKVLPKCGIRSVFQKGKAKLKRLLNTTLVHPKLEEMYVAKAFQKTFFDINENGTEAASASEAIVELDADDEVKPIIFRADRPFAFALYVNRSAVLVIGRYNGE